MAETLELFSAPSLPVRTPPGLMDELAAFQKFGTATQCRETVFPFEGEPRQVPAFINEFWTAKQRQASSLHEISYRACFKPQLPRFFIERLTQPGDRVYDPFMGRGTTPLEAALLGRVPLGNDINPLSRMLIGPRLAPPTLDKITERLRAIKLADSAEFPEELLVFYHPDTLREICALKKYFFRRQEEWDRDLDPIDAWLRMVALNRLTGHSAGFFSVYTLPPNQAVSVESQRKINRKRNQTPPRRDVAQILLKKSRQLLGDVDASVRATLARTANAARLLNEAAAATPQIPANSVALVVTSPPFLNVVQYATDNWLRCWFAGIDTQTVALTVPHKLADWAAAMTAVFRELHRLLQPGGHVAFEVGEVHGGKTKLEETVLPCGMAAGLTPVLVLINHQRFTKTANCWGVDNMGKGTNSNRIVLFRK